MTVVIRWRIDARDPAVVGLRVVVAMPAILTGTSRGDQAHPSACPALSQT
jgi:hypothetical protein